MRSSGVLNEKLFESLELFYTSYGHLLTTLNDRWMHSRADVYARALENLGAPYNRWVAFIDATNIFKARAKCLM